MIEEGTCVTGEDDIFVEAHRATIKNERIRVSIEKTKLMNRRRRNRRFDIGVTLK